jgi:ABC-type dipeptide/oligopeptide/nickel transport system ATPase component
VLFRSQIIPNTKKERDVGLICGASGSGKSYFIKQYIKEYKKTFKKNNIYMFSNLDYDETLDDDLKIDRVKIDEELLTDPLSVEDFENSLVIFDDIDVIRQKELKNAVYQIMDEILETGRHLRVSCLMTVHYPTGNQLKRILNECMFYVYFPWGATRANNYVLENYLGVDKLDIKKIKATKSRWAVIFKNYPQAVITEKAIWMLANNED